MAEIIFEILHAPLRERARVRLLMAEGGGQILTGKRTVGGVEAELHPLCVYILHQLLHPAREIGEIPLQPPLLITDGGLPAVVQIEILVSRFHQSGGLHGGGRLADDLLVDLLPEGIPARPAHGRSQRHTVVVMLGGSHMQLRLCNQLFGNTERANMFLLEIGASRGCACCQSGEGRHCFRFHHPEPSFFMILSQSNRPNRKTCGRATRAGAYCAPQQ